MEGFGGANPHPSPLLPAPLRPSLSNAALMDASPALQLGIQSPGSGLGWVLPSPVILLFLSQGVTLTVGGGVEEPWNWMASREHRSWRPAPWPLPLPVLSSSFREGRCKGPGSSLSAGCLGGLGLSARGPDPQATLVGPGD